MGARPDQGIDQRELALKSFVGVAIGGVCRHVPCMDFLRLIVFIGPPSRGRVHRFLPPSQQNQRLPRILSRFHPHIRDLPDNARRSLKGWDMGMHGAIRDDRTLRRIMAALVALAVLAERAASRSFPVRWLVLSILGSAEAVAREFVAEATRTPQPAIEGIPEIRNAPADAVLLASRFRALAAALGALFSAARRSPCRSACMDSALCHLAPPPARPLAHPGGWRPSPNDTS
jgi:hypothetical protein